MPIREYPQHMFSPTPTPMPTPAPTPTPASTHQRLESNVQRIHWARVYMFSRNSPARLRYVPLRPQRLWRTREEAATQDLWSCRTSFVREQVVRVKYPWEDTWDYFEIKYSLPLIPGFGRSNRALLQLPYCPAFVGKVAVVRRAGPQLSAVRDMHLQDLRKADVAVTSALRTAMGFSGRYQCGIDIEYMLSLGALDNLQ